MIKRPSLSGIVFTLGFICARAKLATNKNTGNINSSFFITKQDWLFKGSEKAESLKQKGKSFTSSCFKLSA
jgi:hypothetical protein